MKKRWLTLGLLLSSTGLAMANETPMSQLPVSEPSNPLLVSTVDAPIQVIVSRKDQSLRVFRGTEEIATSKVSTGKRGHTTPTGIFSILEKRKRHFSNLYNSAPMPYMQRLTWSGIALHESNSVPNYPASHGCVRLPRGFAKKLFGLTERGAHVVIANRDATPELVDHPMLFQPVQGELSASLSKLDLPLLEPAPGKGKIALLDTKPTADPAHALAGQLNRLEEIRKSDKPLRIFITRQARGNLVKEIQTLLNELGYDAGATDGLAGKATYAAVRKFLDAKKGSIEARTTNMRARIDRALLQQLYDTAGKGTVPTGHLFVRHNFKPLFDAPIQISDTDKPLGAHLFTASYAGTNGEDLNWLAVNLGDRFSAELQERLGVDQADHHDGLVASTEVLDRISIPENISAQINHLIGNGASLTISDRGFSRETTPQGTDFIVLTKPTLPTKKELKASAEIKRKARVASQQAAQRKKAKQRQAALVEKQKPKQRTLFSLFSNKKRSIASN